MGMLHELLAVEKDRRSALAVLLAETFQKFGKVDQFFQGLVKSLKMLEDNDANKVVEAQGSSSLKLPTTVYETLEYVLNSWSCAEDVTFQKNVTNRYAIADLMFRGSVIARDVPVDELMGLEVRLTELRKLFHQVPTLPAAQNVQPADEQTGLKNSWVGSSEVTTKTEKIMVPVILAPATDKHPAQVKESTTDKVVGSFTTTKFYGTATSQQKADLLSITDDLIAEVKQARMRANSVTASTETIGNKITEILLSAFR